jgi:hypothetical protein
LVFVEVGMRGDTSMNGFDRNAAMNLKACRSQLTKQQYRTLKGQILAGDSEGAMKGLKRLLERKVNDAEA